MAGPLKGVRVLDLTTVVMGPYACQLMGDYGADVIKVESPEGDVMRLSGPMKNPGMGPLFMSTNRSKRSVVIDLKSPEGRDLLLRLAKQVDILVYNIRPQAMTRLGLGYEELHAANPRLIYLGAFGFSQRGPYGTRPAYDDLIQGMTGIPWLSLKAGSAEPRYAPVILADRIVGLQVAFTAIAALRSRDVSGEGQCVDVPMFENLLTIILGEHLAGSLFEPAIGEPGYQRSLAHNRRPHRTLDGYICTLVYTDKHWRSFFAAIGQEDVFDEDRRFASQNERLNHIDEVYGYLAGVLATRTTAEWIDVLTKADIPVARMNSLDDVLNDEHLRAINFIRTVDHPSEGPIKDMAIATEWSTTRPEVSRLAPKLGEHTIEVLSEAGVDDGAIAELLNKKIIRSVKDHFNGKDNHG